MEWDGFRRNGTTAFQAGWVQRDIYAESKGFSRRVTGTRRLVLRLACALLHPLESMENDRMERGREMIGLSYRSSTREGRACRGRRVSGGHAGGTRLSRPHPVGVRPPIGRDKRVPPVSYFFRAPARSVLTGRRLGVAPWRPAPRRRGYIACRGCTRRKSSRRAYPFCYAMMHTSKR